MSKLSWALITAVLTTVLASAPAPAQESMVVSLAAQPALKSALAAARATEAATIDDQIRFCQVPAPSFKEQARGEVLRRAFVELGLQNVRVDRVGNVLGDRPGASTHPHVVVAAHLDTVFPDGTDVQVKRTGALLHGPGIGDDCRGLAEMVAVARLMKNANIRTPGTITFLANVGEEGLGDLLGMKVLFNETMKDQIDRFVSIDGGGLNITSTAVGSRRYRITFNGPGGHSFGAFGLANPADALGRAIAKIADFRVPDNPLTTFNVGRVGGGTSVNSIPVEAWMEVDLRSADQGALAAIDARFQAAVDAAVVEENRRWGTPRVVTVRKELVGDRPTGVMPEGSPIVQTALAVARTLGLSTPLAQGSGDPNLPISMKIPAIGIGFGGRDIDVHAPTEAFDTTDAWQGTQNALLLTIALAQR
jgi:tripeptide aminopeptidase